MTRLLQFVPATVGRWCEWAFLGLVLLCAHVPFFAERGSPAVNDRYFPAIFEAAWCVLATITTVGYGDIALGGWLGRFVAFLVIVIGISLFGVAIAELSSGLLIEQQAYRIAFPEGSELREYVNRALLRISETGEYDAIYARWFGSAE